MGMLQTLKKKGDRIFGTAATKDKEHTFLVQREKLAEKIGNPRLAKIHFHTIRHWKATMELS